MYFYFAVYQQKINRLQPIKLKSQVVTKPFLLVPFSVGCD